MWPFKKTKKPLTLSGMTTPIERTEILRRGRVVILDDERPEMLEDLKQYGLSVDHWTSTDNPNFSKLETAFYDVLLLDYGGIGQRFGRDEGLDVLRHLKRVNPALRILAFTARTFDASKADFFRMCDGVLKKDSGIREMLEELENQLTQCLTPSAQWRAACTSLNLKMGSSEAAKLEGLILEAVEAPKKVGKVQEALKGLAATGATKVAEALVSKTIELATTWIHHFGAHP